MISPFSRRGRCSASLWQTGNVRLSVLLAVTFVSSVPAFSLPAPSAQSAPVAKAQESYLRGSRGADGKQDALQTEVRRFEPVRGNGPSIYLVAAVHIGEKSYYEQLQRLLDKQDVVLCEGIRRSRTVAKVKSQGAAPRATGVAKRPVGVQQKLADALDLQFQLDGIHYDRPGFRNSDMDMETMTALAEKAGAGTEKQLAQLSASLLDGSNVGLSGQLLNFVLTQAASRPALSSLLRGVLITAFSDPDVMKRSVASGSAELDSIIVVERNKVVLADLKALLKTSKRLPKPMHSVALFYGAGHMKDMEQHLVCDLGYRATNTQWFTAIRATHVYTGSSTFGKTSFKR